MKRAKGNRSATRILDGAMKQIAAKVTGATTAQI